MAKIVELSAQLISGEQYALVLDRDELATLLAVINQTHLNKACRRIWDVVRPFCEDEHRIDRKEVRVTVKETGLYIHE